MSPLKDELNRSTPHAPASEEEVAARREARNLWAGTPEASGPEAEKSTESVAEPVDGEMDRDRSPRRTGSPSPGWQGVGDGAGPSDGPSYEEIDAEADAAAETAARALLVLADQSFEEQSRDGAIHVVVDGWGEVTSIYITRRPEDHLGIAEFERDIVELINRGMGRAQRYQKALREQQGDTPYWES